MEQRTPFSPGETPPLVLLPSPCEAWKTGGTTGAVYDGEGVGGGGGGGRGAETPTIAGCRRSCPGTRAAVRA